MKKIISYMKGLEWLYFGIFIILMILQVILSLQIPEYMTAITDLMQQNEGEMTELIAPAIKMLLCSLGSIASAIVSGYCLSYASSTVIMRMRKDLFTKMISFNLAEMKRFSTSSLITRCTNDMEQVRTFISLGVQALVQFLLCFAAALVNGQHVLNGLAGTLEVLLLQAGDDAFGFFTDEF